MAFVDVAESDDTAAALAEARVHGTRIAFVRGDIADLAQHGAIVDTAKTTLDGIDALVNNAGIAQAVCGDLLDLPPDEFDRVLAVNLRGTFFLTQACAKRMVAASSSNRSRAIVSITSVSAVAASIECGGHCTSKAALSMVVRLFALRLAPHGIGCYEVRPGVIRTDMTAAVSARLRRVHRRRRHPTGALGRP